MVTIFRTLNFTDLKKMAKSILIDCDAGIDDAQALFMALCSPEVNVVAITVVQGNVLPRQVSLNVLRILRVADRLDVSIKSMYFRRFHMSLCTCTDSFLCGFFVYGREKNIKIYK